jgi:hypothetical protein
MYLVELKVGLVEVRDRIEEFSHILRQSTTTHPFFF